MKDTEYLRKIELANAGNGFVPANEAAEELLLRTFKGEVCTFKEITDRDLAFHRCYMALISYIYDLMPNKFKNAIAKEKFYTFLKHLKGNYDIIFEFQDGTTMIEYESISFSKMSQKEFENYINLQLPWIYEELIGEFYGGDKYNEIINKIEDKFKYFLTKLI